jgi:hypothetical protein
MFIKQLRFNSQTLGFPSEPQKVSSESSEPQKDSSESSEPQKASSESSEPQKDSSESSEPSEGVIFFAIILLRGI